VKLIIMAEIYSMALAVQPGLPLPLFLLRTCWRHVRSVAGLKESLWEAWSVKQGRGCESDCS